MALRSFRKDTLQDNWYEERSGALQGVLPFDGKNDYCTTNEHDFVNPSDLKVRNELHKNVDLRMIRRDNFEQAVKSRPLRDRPESGFGAVLPSRDPNVDNRYLETSNQVTFGTMVPTSTLTVPSHQQGVAGGAGGARVERGKAASGASGEVIKVNSDPQKDTRAQRSWMYSKDPIFDAKRAIPEAANQVVAKPAHFRRQATSVTTVNTKKGGIFSDD
ncbi:hypothetical protein H310_05942 [Aphanomyces invadans]|uniref:Uncharacterized protein n=1 Tax=Aphanomyces invadans TaxID=157072 RepID=A0A024U862_9STRA|nr:hypothetical protein H310_05942 [Aphanomyces invadans]ETW02429.1 hypothetical protein H310_05942 [Aphanomyces invadans]|eukprot:XP_008869034.1 hypothetical protein H310_05942 [Aphanomyces invadans]